MPKVDAVGNDVAGIRHPFVEAPLATLTGWKTRRAEFTDGDLCDLNGMMVPLAQTRTERLAASDPRPSVEELYGSNCGYIARVTDAARALAAQRLMLDEDVDRVSREAETNNVLVAGVTMPGPATPGRAVVPTPAQVPRP